MSYLLVGPAALTATTCGARTAATATCASSCTSGATPPLWSCRCGLGEFCGVNRGRNVHLVDVQHRVHGPRDHVGNLDRARIFHAVSLAIIAVISLHRRRRHQTLA